MYRYAQLPPDFLQTPVALWPVAAELDQLAREAEGGQGQALSTPEGRKLLAGQHRELARQVRVCAIAGVLAIDEVPSMSEGWVLAPHPLKIRQHGVDDGVEACVAAVHFPADRDLDASVEEFYRALDAVVRSCPRGSSPRPRPAGFAGSSCVPCTRWADRHLAAMSVAR
ncbi:hypothetical protein ACIQU4_28205 [Streptomyces sp. NPDC090741]|uniref:hypothetical protein n=1 Tax=Streptomyces sp. NPDC090741 TaxID=3365967 RepID=UPI0037F4179A